MLAYKPKTLGIYANTILSLCFNLIYLLIFIVHDGIRHLEKWQQ